MWGKIHYTICDGKFTWNCRNVFLKNYLFLKNEPVNEEYFILGIRDRKIVENIKPGQFFSSEGSQCNISNSSPTF